MLNQQEVIFILSYLFPIVKVYSNFIAARFDKCLNPEIFKELSQQVSESLKNLYISKKNE